MALAEPQPAATSLEWTLGDRLYKARRSANLTQAQVADALGVSRALVSRWELDLSDISASRLRAFADLCKIEMGWLLTFRWTSPLGFCPEHDTAPELCGCGPVEGPAPAGSPEPYGPYKPPTLGLEMANA